nr:hydantoinase/oxoprolinase family protein [Pseudomonadota bacterium]
AEAFSERVLAALTRKSAEVVLETAFAEDGFDGTATVAHALVQRALATGDGIARLSIALDRPVIGLGASAGLHYAGLPPLVGNECVVPDDADVANALGALVGQVRVAAEATVSQPAEGIFRLSVGDDEPRDFSDEGQALAEAEARIRAIVAARALAAGTDVADIAIEREVKASVIQNRRMFVEAQLVATATGRPRIAE